MKSVTAVIARICFALPFGIFGVMHFLGGRKMASLVPAWVPGGWIWVYITVAALILASASIISGKLSRVASFCLAVLLGAFVATVHFPGLLNSQTQQAAMAGLLKDFSLMGGALTYAGISAKKG